MKASRIIYFVSIPVLALLVFAIGLGSAAAAPQANTPDVSPVFVAGNPSCQTQGYSFGFKINLSPNGTFTLTNPPGELTGGAPSDPSNSVTISNSDGTLFDWTSTLGIDAVIVKGGPNADAYIYDPPAESTGNGGLHAPLNTGNNKYYDISHIEFCYDYELTASKTANAIYTRTYSWTILKTVDDDKHAGFTGDSFVSNYVVAVDQTVTDSNYAVSGTITVNNPTPFTVSFSVSDSVGGTNATVSCPTNSLTPGASTVCSYSASLGDKTDGTNTATITSNTSGVKGATASANYTFGAPTTVVGNSTVNVTDSVKGSLGSASGDKEFKYGATFTCDDDEGENPNTATIVETGQTSDANVDVACYELTVTKTAETTFNRDWDWTIVKTGDQTDLILSTGQSFLVNYDVTVNATKVDSDYAVSGQITVSNPAPFAANLTSVNDVLPGASNLVVNCPALVVPAGGNLVCTYSADLPDNAARTNTATATLQNTPSGTTSFTGSANVTFGNSPTTETDECIDVVDDKFGTLGTVCASELLKTFEYSLTVGPYAVCGDYTYENTATFTTKDTGATGSDNHIVNVTVPCANGCTLTQGYWKTHSDRGPAPYDDAWKNLGALEEDTLFFNSGKTWYNVFWTPPAGNAFYNLAHQYMAAKLNILNGASTTPAVVAAISGAEALFSAQGAGDVSLTKSETKTALSLASTLDQYNNGLIGPGHCSE